MSGLYLVGIIVLWVWLTWIFLRFSWCKVFRKEKIKSTEKLLIGVVILAWLGGSFWLGGGRKLYYDWHVEQMCAVDGGVKVYERVTLPASMFDKWGGIHVPEKRRAASDDEYYYESDTTYLKNGSPNIVRMHTQIFRRSDKKVLGESVYYGRGGGDLYGPWNPSGFTCPDPTSGRNLESSVFQQGAQ